ncbi:MAG: GNAT family N-acetyltransferase [Candidatus Thorarchaeota archaeon]
MLVDTMIIEIPSDKHPNLIALFEGNQYLGLLSKSLLRQRLGVVYVDDLDEPKVAMLSYKFLIFVTGDANYPLVPELLERVPQRFLLVVPDDTWTAKMKEHWGEKLKSRERTKFSSKNLTIEHMNNILEEIPESMHLEPLTRDTIHLISQQAKGIVKLLFPDLDSFMKTNFGYCLRKDDRIISLTLAATPFEEGNFEIHIETDPEYQKRGLAMIPAAKLIKHSLEMGLVPHWDADNPPSAKLATKLGFTDPDVYQTHFWLE